MMKQLITITMIALTSGVSASNYMPSIDLNDQAQVRELIIEFTASLKNKDFDTERRFRTDEVKWWYKSIENDFQLIPADSSLAYIGFLDSLKMADELQIDLENRLIMRTYYLEKDNIENKHRYAFHVDEDGKIDGILYVPPLTPEYFTDWSEDDFELFATRLDSNIYLYYDEAMNWSEMEYVSYGCGEVMPLVEEIGLLAELRRAADDTLVTEEDWDEEAGNIAQADQEYDEELDIVEAEVELTMEEVYESTEELVESDPADIPYRRRLN